MPATTPTRLEGDVYVVGQLYAGSMRPIANSVDDDSVEPGAGLNATKIQQQDRVTYGQPNVAATSETKVIHLINGVNGLITKFVAGSIVAAIGAATVTIDLKKNGATILTGVITLNNGVAALAKVAGVLTGGAVCVAGDVFTIVIVATAGGGTLPTGVFCQLIGLQDPA